MTNTNPTAQQKYDEFMEDESEKSALERLRFFCSLSMNGQDWLDVEKYFDDVERELTRIQSAEMPNKVIRYGEDMHGEFGQWSDGEYVSYSDYVEMKAYAERKEAELSDAVHLNDEQAQRVFRAEAEAKDQRERADRIEKDRRRTAECVSRLRGETDADDDLKRFVEYVDHTMNLSSGYVSEIIDFAQGQKTRAESAERELAECRKDADRYRWLRELPNADSHSTKKAATGDLLTRKLVLKWWQLPMDARREIALDLGLISDDEIKLPEAERYGRALLRAGQRNMLEKLKGEIEKWQNK
jgi:hypothetical protein